MASLSTHYIHNGGWNREQGSLITGYAGIGPYDGNSKVRSVFKISLKSLSNGYRRSDLKVSMTVADTRAININDSLHYILSSSFSQSGIGPDGTVYDTGDTSSFKSGYGGEVSTPQVTLDTSDVPSTKNTVYLWVYSNNNNDYDTSYTTYTIQSLTLNEGNHVLVKSNVTTGSITTNGQIYVPGQTITVSWNQASAGAGNVAVGSVSAFLRTESAPTTSTYNDSETGLANDATSCDLTIPSTATQGQKVYAGVIAYSAESGYDGSLVTKQIGIINTPPKPPTVTKTSNQLTSTNTITFNLTLGSDTNTTQTRTAYYSFNGGASKTRISGTSLTINSNTSGVKPGSNTITFFTYDGLQYSTGTDETFTATFKPVISNPSAKHTTVQNMSGTSGSLVSETNINFSMQTGSAASVTVYVRASSTSGGLASATQKEVPASSVTYSEGSPINIKMANIGTDLVPQGYYFQYAFKVSDGATSSDMTTWLSQGLRPKAPLLPTYTGYSNHENEGAYNATALDNYFWDYVTINFTKPSNDNSCAKVSRLSIRAYYSNTDKAYDYDLASSANYLKMDLSQNVNANANVTFKFEVVDVAGQISTADIKKDASTILILIKTSKISFGKDTVQRVDNTNLKPLTNAADLTISHPFAEASGTPDVVYKYYLELSGLRELLTVKSTQNIGSAQKNAVIAAATINDKALSLVDKAGLSTNLAHGAKIIILAADGFAQTTSLSTDITLNFTEPPVLQKGAIILKHDYFTSPSAALTTTTGTRITSTSNLNIRMVNTGEGIIFGLPKATDPNGDISKYHIYLARYDFNNEDEPKAIIPANASYNAKPWHTVEYSDLEKGPQDTDYYYYRVNASLYTKNEFFFFKLQAADETGNLSTPIYSDTYIIGCRTVSPTFSTGNVTVERNGDQVTLKFKFQITDLGGSARASGWNRGYYNSYPNFERSGITGYTPEASLLIEIAPDQSFTQNVIAASPEVFTPGNGDGLADFTLSEKVFEGFSASHAKVFMRFTLTVSYGLKDRVSGVYTLATVSSNPQIYTYFGAVPTVAHRAHKVGINTNALGDDDVLVVENYQGTRYVKFKGTDASNASQTYEITFDLLNGTITGAVINCGEW